MYLFFDNRENSAYVHMYGVHTAWMYVHYVYVCKTWLWRCHLAPQPQRKAQSPKRRTYRVYTYLETLPHSVYTYLYRDRGNQTRDRVLYTPRSIYTVLTRVLKGTHSTVPYILISYVDFSYIHTIPCYAMPCHADAYAYAPGGSRRRRCIAWREQGHD